MEENDGTITVSYKRSMLIGFLLGDAYSRPRSKRSVEFVFKHGTDQLDYLEWKAQRLNEAFGENLSIKDGRNNFSLTRGRRYRVIHKWFHKNGRKSITDKIRFMDHPIGLAVLICDDGSIRKRKKKHKDGSIYYLKPSITIATHCFNEGEVNILLSHIEKICGAKGYINPERRWRNGKRVKYARVNFNVKNSKMLWFYVSEWIPKIASMNRKFSYAYESLNW